MSGFLATLAIVAAGSVVASVIIYFSSRREPSRRPKDLEELKRKLFDKIEQDVRDVRESYETEKV